MALPVLQQLTLWGFLHHPELPEMIVKQFSILTALQNRQMFLQQLMDKLHSDYLNQNLWG